MAVRDKGRRRLRREALNRFQEGFDFARLDYQRRVQPLRGKAKLSGVMVAGMVYFAGFAFGYFGWQQQSVSYEVFARLVWILMVPATAAGAFAWLLRTNRLEFTVRDDIRHYIRQREGRSGWLWCFAPLQDALAPADVMARQVMRQSRSAIDQLDPEDYARTVTALHQLLEQVSGQMINTDIASQVLDNLASLPD